jgi:uroporphyrin-3 C-methyltransferase
VHQKSQLVSANQQKTGQHVTDANETLPAADVKKPAPQAKKKKNLSWLLILVIALIAAFSIASAIYFWQNLSQQNTLLSHLDSQNKSAQQRVQYLEQSLERRLKNLEADKQQQSQILTQLDRQSLYNTEKLTEMGASSRADWLLAEAEYLLHLANQRLLLERDLKNAEAVMISADKVLAEINDPGLLPVRAALNQEILSLQQLSHLDREGMFMQLSAIISSLDGLKESAYLDTSKPEPEQTPSQRSSQTSDLPAWKQAWLEVWGELNKAVLIRRLDHPVAPLMAPEQNYYLKQNLRLMLEQANLALLEQNQAIFTHSLKQASIWLENYFDTQDKQTKTLISKLKSMQTLQISYETPDISKSLRLLKTKIEAMYLNHSLGKLSNPTPSSTDNSTKQEPTP